jgi:hypothetical protein
MLDNPPLVNNPKALVVELATVVDVQILSVVPVTIILNGE